MKNLIYILIIAIGLVACEKEEIPAPTPQPITPTSPTTVTTTTPTNPTTVTTVTPIDTTGNGNTDKVKLYYSLNLKSLKTTVTDYVHNTDNVRIYHNTTRLQNHVIANNPVDATLGLSLIENCDCNQGVANAALMVSHGDSIVIEFDHLEYNMNNNVPSERFLSMFCRFYDENKNQLTQMNIPDAVAQGTYPNTNDPAIGYGVNQFTGYNWLLGKSYRMVYHIQ